MSIDTLVAEYPGDGAWMRFAASFPNASAVARDQSCDHSLIHVLVAELGDQATQWMATPARVLDGLSPTQVIAAHPQGLLAVRTAVMRMPR